MSRINLKQSPYYDDYDFSKQYVQFLAVPGRVAQSREFTSLQSAMREIIKSIGDSILKNGDIIEGCQIIKSGNDITVTAGKIYMEGIVMPVENTTLTITGEGTEIIGVTLDEYLIDEYTDPTLRDPAQGYDNYNQPGCHRLKRVLDIVLNEDGAATIATFIDGEQMVENLTPEYDTLSQTLARRTYDESGSYLVNGLKVRTEVLGSNENNYYNLVVESGKAYVLGYELKIPTARRIKVSKSTDYSAASRRRTYVTGTTDYLIHNSPYVRSIINVIGVKSTSEQQSASTNVDAIQLKKGDVLRVTSVYYGSETYTVGESAQEGKDCYLDQVGNTYYLVWNGKDHWPGRGNQYTVVYEYYKTFDNSDYQLVLSNGSHYIRWVGDTPENNTIFTVNYNQYLARIDIVYMDRYGSIKVIEGVPAEHNSEVAPEAPLNTLILARVDNPPNGSVISTESSESIGVSNIGLTRFTMNDIRSLMNRLQTVEYDQAVLSLNDEARQVNTDNDKKGIFTDPFIDISKIDFYYNKNGDTKIDPTKPIYDMALDLSANIAYLPVKSESTEVSFSTTSTASKYDRLITLTKTGENVALSQMNATKSFPINPYSMFPQMPEVSVTPSVDSWIDDTIIEVPRSLTNATIVAMSTRTIDNRSRYTINNSNYSTRTSTTTTDTAIGTQTESYSTENIIKESAITYIRKRTLTVEGSDFPSNLDNINCYFDGVKVNLTPVGSTVSGTEAGSVKSDSNGYLKATFMIPDKILTGTREVLLKSDIVREGFISEGFTLYIAQGISRTIQRTVTTVTTVLLERTTTTTLRSVYVDPVGQTFVLDRMTIIKGIDLYFESKPSTSTPVICEIRGVENGNITSKIYAHTSLKPEKVSVSSNSTVATRFNFSDPVLLEEDTEYAFVVRSTSDDYALWVAELGGTDVNTGSTILKNALLSGVMMSSSNNSTWTAHQTTDLKFRLIEDIYAMNAVAQFDNISVNNFSRILLSADSATPNGTSVSWSYSTDGASYTSLTPYTLSNIGSIQSNVSLRAVLSRESTANNLTPMIALDTVTLTTSCYDTTGAYISRNISGLDPYTSVKVIVDTYEPTGTSLAVKVSNNDGATMVTATEGSSTTLSYGWREVVYNATLTSSTQCRIFIEASSTSSMSTPAIRRLRVIMS